jgi:hypothetical protein
MEIAFRKKIIVAATSMALLGSILGGPALATANASTTDSRAADCLIIETPDVIIIICDG